MEQHDLIQGTSEWHQHRSSHFNASDAPSMLGLSPYKSRSELLREKATGITKDVDAVTQRRFDDGHHFEALARPLAEQLIGKKLYPVIGSEGKLSASFDGLTADDMVCWEHKTGNAELLESLRNNVIPEHYHPQIEQQLMLSGAERCLFSATKWDGDVLVAEAHCWYTPNVEMRYRLLQGWEQFERDLANYQHVEITEKPKADTIMDLPALSVQATGMVTYSNLPEFKKAAENYIANINTDLQTDQHFADAEATVKFCKATEDKLEVTKKAILAQTSTIDEVIRTVDHIQAQLRDKRLMLDKLVKSEKEARKAAMVAAARENLQRHIETLQSEINGVCLTFAPADFGGAIKGLKSLASMQDALDTMIANHKIVLDTLARDVRAKLTWYKEHATGHSVLFPDLQQLIVKPMEDFTLAITSRIEKAKAEEAARLEAQRQRMEADAKAKAEREAAAKLVEETARIRAEERTKAEEAAKALATEKARMAEAILSTVSNPPKTVEETAAIIGVKMEPAAPALSVVELPSRYSRPTDDQIIAALAMNFRTHESKVIEWLLDMDLTAASERMAREFA